jgi:hypothetical protein
VLDDDARHLAPLVGVDIVDEGEGTKVVPIDSAMATTWEDWSISP